MVSSSSRRKGSDHQLNGKDKDGGSTSSSSSSSSNLSACPILIISTSVLSFLFLFLFFDDINHNNIITPRPRASIPSNNHAAGCNLFQGRWVEEEEDDGLLLLYNSTSCGSIPGSKNCFLHGRPDAGFLKWRWRPDDDGCRLDRFNASEFLEVVRGKRAAFVGDSVARNQVDSLVCMLATVEVPVDVYRDAKDRCRTWYFGRHNFTLMVLWTKFLVKAKERGINGKPTGSFDLQTDQVDDSWASQLTHHQLLEQDHVIVISASQWFFRKNYLYREAQLVGCTNNNCDHPAAPAAAAAAAATTTTSPSFAIGTALRTSLAHIIDTINNNNTTTSNSHRQHLVIVRTISPSHFENGTWNTGGSCSRKKPLLIEQEEMTRTPMPTAAPAAAAAAAAALRMIIIDNNYSTDGRDLFDQWEVRKVQMEEVDKARQRAAAAAANSSCSSKPSAIRMEALDITWAMLMRPDGHPGHYWRDKKTNNNNDCVHWCLPGPVDTWNHFLLPLLRNNYYN